MIRNRKKILLFLFALFFIEEILVACTTPVFQYAMERWRQAYYDGVLFYEGSLTKNEKERLASFQKMMTKDNIPLNLQLEKLDVRAKPDKADKLLQDVASRDFPLLALWFPREKGNTKPFWIGEFNMSKLTHIIQSEKRREISNHLVEGKPVVWVLILPGTYKHKDKVEDTLRGAIMNTASSLRNTPQFESMISSENMRDFFPVVTVSSDESEESVFISMITGIKKGSSLEKPVVIPVFGRGRALTTFTADKICNERIYSISRFLLSACACQIKLANPGTDMLIKAEWNQAFNEFGQQSTASPTLTSVMPDTTTLTAENDSIIDLTSSQTSSFFSTKLLSVTGTIVIALVIVIGALTFIVLKRK